MDNIVTEPSALDYGKPYTYADYLTWQFQERMEILKGKLFKMSLASSKDHQIVSRELCFIFTKFFKQNPCHVFIAPFDVRLNTNGSKDEQITTVFQPDLCVICDESKLDDRGCLGAPDLIVEILSPGNSTKEMNTKFQIYEEAGVREYWMVDYADQYILRYYLDNGKYLGLKPLTIDEECESYIFPYLKFKIAEIFPF